MSEADDQRQVRESIEHIADRAAAKAVRDTLMLIGVDLSDPIKAQEEFATLRSIASPAVQSDLAWLKRLHGAADVASDAGWRAIIRVLVTASLGGLVIVTKDYWEQWLTHLFWGK